MSNKKVVRNELSKYAQQIENLAKQVQTTLSQGGDPLTVANELVRNSSTFIFVLGEMYALERSGKKVKATVVANPSGTPVVATQTPRNRHNLRDASGRFVRV
jgi:hypothetical protein